MPTLSELCDADCPENIDGISFLPTLLGNQKQQKKHKYLYWEHLQKIQAVRKEAWKAIRLSPQQEIELYNLIDDIGETVNVAENHPEIVEEMKQILIEGRTESELHPLMWDK